MLLSPKPIILVLCNINSVYEPYYNILTLLYYTNVMHVVMTNRFPRNFCLLLNIRNDLQQIMFLLLSPFGLAKQQISVGTGQIQETSQVKKGE